METPHSGSPRRKLLVPSIGSTTQQRSPAPPPLSSPRKPSSGKALASRVRINASTSRSAMLTKSCGPFVSRVNAALREKYPAAASPASRIKWVAVVRRASIVMAGQDIRGVQGLLYAAFFIVAIVAMAHLWWAIRGREDKRVFRVTTAAIRRFAIPTAEELIDRARSMVPEI